MNRAQFYAALRSRGNSLFGTSLAQGQVDGIDALLDACQRHHITDAHHVANILAQVYRETGGKMAPVRETFAASDQQAINRLEAAWKAGKLPWVTTPYWRGGWFGRGQIQLTWKENYDKIGRAIGRDLIGHPELALTPSISADIAVVGMSRGLFTGKKLADYSFPSALEKPPDQNPRRIVNGQDGTDAKVAGYHRAFFAAIQGAGGWQDKPRDVQPSVQQPDPAPRAVWLAALLASLGKLLGKIFQRKG